MRTSCRSSTSTSWRLLSRTCRRRRRARRSWRCSRSTTGTLLPYAPPLPSRRALLPTPRTASAHRRGAWAPPLLLATQPALAAPAARRWCTPPRSLCPGRCSWRRSRSRRSSSSSRRSSRARQLTRRMRAQRLQLQRRLRRAPAVPPLAARPALGAPLRTACVRARRWKRWVLLCLAPCAPGCAACLGLASEVLTWPSRPGWLSGSCAGSSLAPAAHEQLNIVRPCSCGAPSAPLLLRSTHLTPAPCAPGPTVQSPLAPFPVPGRTSHVPPQRQQQGAGGDAVPAGEGQDEQQAGGSTAAGAAHGASDAPGTENDAALAAALAECEGLGAAEDCLSAAMGAAALGGGPLTRQAGGRFGAQGAGAGRSGGSRSWGRGSSLAGGAGRAPGMPAAPPAGAADPSAVPAAEVRRRALLGCGRPAYLEIQPFCGGPVSRCRASTEACTSSPFLGWSPPQDFPSLTAAPAAAAAAPPAGGPRGWGNAMALQSLRSKLAEGSGARAGPGATQRAQQAQQAQHGAAAPGGQAAEDFEARCGLRVVDDGTPDTERRRCEGGALAPAYQAPRRSWLCCNPEWPAPAELWPGCSQPGLGTPKRTQYMLGRTRAPPPPPLPAAALHLPACVLRQPPPRRPRCAAGW